MNILVTGGGFLGSRITQMLLQRGDQVRLLSRRKYANLAKLGAECVAGDIREFDAVSAACGGMDAVIHTAAKAKLWGDRREFFDINSRGTANIIQGCLANNVTKLVYTSTPSVVFNRENIENGDESMPYAKRFLAAYPESKAKAEAMVLDANGWEMVCETRNPDATDITEKFASEIQRLATCALRPHLIWGPGDPHFIPTLLEKTRAQKLRRVGVGDNRVSITYIDNAAHAHLLALDCLQPGSPVAGNAYFINDPAPVNLWNWLGNVIAGFNIPPLEKVVSYKTAYRLGAVCELAYKLLPRLGDQPPMTRFLAEQLGKSHWFSVEKAKRDFGYAPVVAPATGMKNMLEHFNANFSTTSETDK